MPAIEKTFYGTSAVNIKSLALTDAGAVTTVPGLLWGFSSDPSNESVIKDGGSSGKVIAYAGKNETSMFAKPIEVATSLYVAKTAGGNIVVYYE
jgi:hypothetical protein